MRHQKCLTKQHKEQAEKASGLNVFFPQLFPALLLGLSFTSHAFQRHSHIPLSTLYSHTMCLQICIWSLSFVSMCIRVRRSVVDPFRNGHVPPAWRPKMVERVSFSPCQQITAGLAASGALPDLMLTLYQYSPVRRVVSLSSELAVCSIEAGRVTALSCIMYQPSLNTAHELVPQSWRGATAKTYLVVVHAHSKTCSLRSLQFPGPTPGSVARLVAVHVATAETDWYIVVQVGVADR